MYLFLAASVALLHLFALNLLYPKFVGARVHLNPSGGDPRADVLGHAVGRHRADAGDPSDRRDQGGL